MGCIDCNLYLRDAQYKFRVCQGFPDRYLHILVSNDKYDSKKKVYIIKSLKFCSLWATQFIPRADKEMDKCDANIGKRSQRHKQEEPVLPKDSVLTQPPKNLPINSYDPTWYNSHPIGENTRIADTFSVVFLVDGTKSICGIQHPDKKLSDFRFGEKYWEQIIEPYDISHEIINQYNDDDNEDSLD
ncbi:hypothetical protein O181_001417 [Austropuccinia psidii MF-1]|uniref:Uncharacterized protein n=1 Tax=Austropuccinia psidii MF-1 TaxID=1389203 RepID=A0A9Q3BAS0_9BASI|nr:hypothetical protein [Austropuccinia psidii MF-1]